MKIILITILLLLSSVSFAVASSSEDSVNPDIEHLANTICARMSLSLSTGVGSPHGVFKEVISNYLGISEEASSSREQITSFWNKHSERMVCTQELIGFPTPQHTLKRVVELGAISDFYFGYFLKDRAMKINSIEYINGQPETLLDYIDAVLTSPRASTIYNTGEIKQLRAYITTLMNAKHAADLIKE